MPLDITRLNVNILGVSFHDVKTRKRYIILTCEENKSNFTCYSNSVKYSVFKAALGKVTLPVSNLALYCNRTLLVDIIPF